MPTLPHLCHARAGMRYPLAEAGCKGPDASIQQWQLLPALQYATGAQGKTPDVPLAAAPLTDIRQVTWALRVLADCVCCPVGGRACR